MQTAGATVTTARTTVLKRQAMLRDHVDGRPADPGGGRGDAGQEQHRGQQRQGDGRHHRLEPGERQRLGETVPALDVRQFVREDGRHFVVTKQVEQRDVDDDGAPVGAAPPKAFGVATSVGGSRSIAADIDSRRSSNVAALSAGGSTGLTAARSRRTPTR